MKLDYKKIPKIKLADLISLSLRNFKVKTGRTFLTVLGIGVSFATIFFLISLGYGLQNILLKEISSEEMLLTLDVYSPNQTVLPLDSKFTEAIRQTKKASKIDPIIATRGQMDISGTSFEVLIQGVSQDFFKSNDQKIKKGIAPKESENTALITSELEKLLIGENNIKDGKGGYEILGSNIKLTYYIPELVDGNEIIKVEEAPEQFKIIGSLDGGSGNYLYIPFSKVSNFNLPYYRVKILAKDYKALDEIKAKIAELGFSASSVADTVDQANKIFNILKIILAFFGVAALIVSIVGMINTMTIALLERTNEIGVMKIFGIAESDIQKLFMLESTIIGFLGGVSGLVMGYVFSQIFNLSILFLASTLGGKSVNLFYYPMWFIIAIVAFASFVGLVTGYFPSKRAAKLDPLVALRYK